ncbi:MAG: beta-galactosidase [Verrucomicrobiota bacterium]
MNPYVKIEEGVLHVDGKPTFAWTADYPYYRDQRADWSSQLDSLKKMNVNVVTFYIPWRHHAPKDPLRAGGIYDFSGQLHDRTDVLEFIRLIRAKGMFCIVKPGPYIHAETRFGSLPDYVLPDNNPRIQVRVDQQGRPNPACWGFERPPAPMDPEYLPYVKEWFHTVARQVIVPNEYPHGPILAVQVLNEGVYSDGGAGVDKFNFESSAVAHYAKFLDQQYGSIDQYNAVCGARFASFSDVPAPGPWSPRATRGEVRPWIDWAGFGQYFYKLILTTYVGYLREAGVTVPAVLNLNPPPSTQGVGLETVMGRYNAPYLSDVIAYGYTNWTGLVSHDVHAWWRYRYLARAARGINMEENWGFDSYDPPHYWHVQPSFFQSMAYLLMGATGLNIYLGVSCDCWTDYLAVDAGGVYMHNHPIAEDGSYRSSFWTCHQMGALMRNIGSDLVSREKIEPIAWVFYTPYAQAASWESPADDWRKAGFSDRPRAASPGWDRFMALCDHGKTENGICYPREESVERLLQRKILFLDGGDWMDAATQQKLLNYVERGGVLVITSRVPEMDEFFHPCRLLKDALFPCEMRVVDGGTSFEYRLGDGRFRGTGRGTVLGVSKPGRNVASAGAVRIGNANVTCSVTSCYGRGKAMFLGLCPWLDQPGDSGHIGLIEYLARELAGVAVTASIVPEPADPLVEVAQYRGGVADRRYVFMLTRQEKPAMYRFRLTDAADEADVFEIQLSGRSGALVGFERGRIAAAMIKGWNDLDKVAAAPMLKFGEHVLAAADPCDLYFCRRADGPWEVSVVNVQNEAGRTAVSLPIPREEVSDIVQVTSAGREIAVGIREIGGCAVFTAADMRNVEPVAELAEGEWSPCYIIRPRSP